METPEMKVAALAKSLGLGDLPTIDLLRTHAAVLAELNTRRITRTKNNPVGGYAEWLVAERLGCTLETNSTTGFDAKSPTGDRYEVKSRHITPGSTSLQSSAIRNLAAHHFDYLIALVFEFDYRIRYALKIPFEVVTTRAVYRKHVNGHVLKLSPDLVNEVGVQDITIRLAG